MNRELIEVGPGVYLTGEIPRRNPLETGDKYQLSITSDGTIHQPDLLADDLSMVVLSAKGLILVLGCAHAGLINIISYVTEKFPDQRIYAVVGGTHLGFAGEDQLEETVKVLNHLQIDKIGVSHCTGLPIAAQLSARLGERFFFANAGTVFEIPD